MLLLLGAGGDVDDGIGGGWGWVEMVPNAQLDRSMCLVLFSAPDMFHLVENSHPS